MDAGLRISYGAGATVIVDQGYTFSYAASVIGRCCVGVGISYAASRLASPWSVGLPADRSSIPSVLVSRLRMHVAVDGPGDGTGGRGGTAGRRMVWLGMGGLLLMGGWIKD